MTFTAAELLRPEPGIGQRFDRFEFELCDRNHLRIGVLKPIADQTPTITASTERTVMRELSGLQLDVAAGLDINIFTDRLRPIMVLQNGDRFPLGFYVFGEYQRPPWAPRCYDQAWVLDQPIERTVSIPAGLSAGSTISTLCRDVGITRVRIEASSTVGAEPRAWPAGTSRYKILDEIATSAACFKPYFDNDGILRFRPVPDPNSPVANHVYGPGRIIAQSMLESNDSYKAPNRYLCTATSSEAPIVAWYDVPAEAPHSIANRGYVVAQTVDANGVADVAAALAAAQAAYVADTRTWQKVSFESLLDPRHDLFDVISYTHDPATTGYYLETGARMELRYDGSHTHELSRLWRTGLG